MVNMKVLLENLTISWILVENKPWFALILLLRVPFTPTLRLYRCYRDRLLVDSRPMCPSIIDNPVYQFM